MPTSTPSLLSHSVSLMAKMAGFAGLRLRVAVIHIHADATKRVPPPLNRHLFLFSSSQGISSASLAAAEFRTKPGHDD